MSLTPFQSLSVGLTPQTLPKVIEPVSHSNSLAPWKAFWRPATLTSFRERTSASSSARSAMRCRRQTAPRRGASGHLPEESARFSRFRKGEARLDSSVENGMPWVK